MTSVFTRDLKSSKRPLTTKNFPLDRTIKLVIEEATDNRANTLLDLCDDGKVDAGLRTIDGAIYLFKKFGFTIVNLDGAKANVSYVTKTTFDFLPYAPEYAITITDPDNARYGLSLFYKVGLSLSGAHRRC